MLLAKFSHSLFVVALAGNLAIQLSRGRNGILVGLVAAGKAHDPQAGGQVSIDGEIVQRRDELAMRQVAGGAER